MSQRRCVRWIRGVRIPLHSPTMKETEHNEDNIETTPEREPEAVLSEPDDDIEVIDLGKDFPEKPLTNGDLMDNGNKVERDADGKIISGVLNPNGRPKGTRNFTTKVREALEFIAELKENDGSMTNEQALVKTIMKKAIAGDVLMIKTLWEFLDGKPSQTILNQFDDEVESIEVTIINSKHKRDETQDQGNGDIRPHDTQS